MSKVYKSSQIVMDHNNRVTIDIDQYPSIDKEEPLFMPDENNRFDEADEGELIPANLVEEAKKEAEKIIDEANAYAAQMLENVKIEAENEATLIKKDASEQGYNEGYTKGVAEAETIKVQAQTILENAHTEKEELLRHTEPEIIELITKLVDKLLTDEVEINPQVISILVRQGLMRATLSGELAVHVSKDDYEQVMADSDSIISSFETMAKIIFVEDISLKKSDCIIETNFGSIDCSLKNQKKGLYKNLFYLLNNR